ncbi:dCTP deaminase [bacterium (Candidatus Howlettbacteria) CG_4_10_14_0_8_um_filter_40_9]|nr:MAG: dCTP deaminase [bacterium (Candidatus Howlettbacteria) CG_4_10_14_0_8_um_filter_40_9]
MFLGVDKLLELVKSQKLVEDLCDRELNNPEGTGFDLRVKEFYKISGHGFLGIDERETCKIEKVAEFDEKKSSKITLKPGDFYLVTTVEKVNLPANLVGFLKPRSTLHRMGLYLQTTQIAPGYAGELTLALKNLGDATVDMELGSRIVHVMFSQVDGQTNLYRGQWKGGRVTTSEKEVQV